MSVAGLIRQLQDEGQDFIEFRKFGLDEVKAGLDPESPPARGRGLKPCRIYAPA